MTGKHQTQARHIVDILGGPAKAAEITGMPVESWLKTGWIHGKYHRDILLKAWALGIRIHPIDFMRHVEGLTPADAEREPELVGA